MSADAPRMATRCPAGLVEPLVEELPAVPEFIPMFRRLAAGRHAIVFDSAQSEPERGRYSFAAADPFEFLVADADEAGAFARFAERMRCYVARRLRELPPFQGGAAGLFAYDLGRQFERLPLPAGDEFRVPALAVGLYDVVLAIDHIERRAWIISHGFPEIEPVARRRRASQRLAEFRGWLTGDSQTEPASPDARLTPISAADLVRQFPVRGEAALSSNFSRDGYLRAVDRAIEYIRAGDLFQVNLSQRLLHPATTDSISLYERLRERNAAPFAGYFDLGEFQIVSASPERFLRVVDGHVEARPIKGTRRRMGIVEADLFAGDELLLSEKDRAENIMIVDLLRNDLSRACLPESVHVTQFCEIEHYRYVQHLVSAVCGRLRPGATSFDLFAAAFPGGSITGAPKVRAMEIIAELEPTARGAYCGSLGYVGFDGSLDASILIRTITAGRGWWQAPVGGGIVAQSTPEREYEETWDKAAGMLRAFE